VDSGRETLPTRVRYGKWAGLYGGVIATFVHQQVNSTWIYARCPERTLRFVLIFAIACASFSIVLGAWSWSVRQSLRHDAGAHLTTKTDRFIASLSAAIALIGVAFVAFSSAAAWFLQCQR
jgi:TRAP-type C4-dicarboxylate transport system permease small subunit